MSGGSFFQVNRYLVDALVDTVAGGRAGDVALDLYAGVGLFTVALASSFRHIVAVESSQGSARDLQYNSPENVKVVRSTVDEYLTAKVEDSARFDPGRSAAGRSGRAGYAWAGQPGCSKAGLCFLRSGDFSSRP